MTLEPFRGDLAQRMRDFFAEVDYTAERLQLRMGMAEIPSRRLRTLGRVIDQTREPTALNTLARWFYIGVPVKSKQASELIPDWALSAMLESGLLARQEGNVAPQVRISPVDKLLLVSDSALDADGERPSDLVLWPNPTTRLLSRFTVRRPSRLTLDLGTGCGLHAFEASAHSERVVATDLNPRAIEFAAFSAHFNGIENVEFLSGDTFEPVRGRKFDLIVANPPFFITPSKHYLYCDNHFDLDGFCRRLAREAPEHLNEGGYFQMLCEWAQVEGEPWQERVVQWLTGSGCDAWALKVSSSEISRYAQEHFKLSVPYASGDEGAFAEWMDYYRARKVEAIHGGLIAMRRRSGRNWIRIDEPPSRPAGAFGDAVAQVFANRDFLETNSSDERILAARLKLAANAQLDEQHRPGERGWERTGMTLRLTGGVPCSIPLQPQVAEFIAGCDGARTVQELTEGLASQVSAEPGQVRTECLKIVRQLLEQSLLLPSGL